MDGQHVGRVGERSALAHALFWAERIGTEVFAGCVSAAENDAASGWIEVAQWGRNVTKTEVWVTDWAGFWLGLLPVPGWPSDGAEAERWAFHLPQLTAQRALALRILARHILRREEGETRIHKSDFLRALRTGNSADRDAIRVQFYAELRAAVGERLFDRGDLATSHLRIAAALPESARSRVAKRRRRPTVRELSTLK